MKNYLHEHGSYHVFIHEAGFSLNQLQLAFLSSLLFCVYLLFPLGLLVKYVHICISDFTFLSILTELCKPHTWRHSWSPGDRFSEHPGTDCNGVQSK